MRRAGRSSRRHGGFTLVEVLVALMLMAILTGLAWRALDGILRGRDASRESIDRTTRLATVLTQWEQDLQALHDAQIVPPISFDGQTLRLTRRVDTGVALVAWSLRSGVWQRWGGPAYQRSGDLQEAWLRSQQFQGTEPGHVAVADGVTQWQIYFHRGGQWSNAQSTGDIVQTPVPPVPPAPGASPPPRVGEALPDAVRMQITLSTGMLTRDIALGPSS